ncbi:hypothetical protein ABPG72_017842 [Tetrahymena utriculariae]
MTSFSYNRYGRAAAIIIKQGNIQLKNLLVQQILKYKKNCQNIRLNSTQSPQSNCQPLLSSNMLDAQTIQIPKLQVIQQPQQLALTQTTLTPSLLLSNLYSQQSDVEVSFSQLSSKIVEVKSLIQKALQPIQSTQPAVIPSLPKTQLSQKMSIPEKKTQVDPLFTHQEQVKQFFNQCGKEMIDSKPQSAEFHHSYTLILEIKEIVDGIKKTNESSDLICKISGCKQNHFPFNSIQYLIQNSHKNTIIKMFEEFYFKHQVIMFQKY